MPYGVISNRHGKGALPGELPRTGHNVSVFAAVEGARGCTVRHAARDRGRPPGRRFSARAVLGTMGVAVAADERPHSVPPGTHGGNIDINLLVEDDPVPPVQVEGAMAYVGDPHFAQGDGEVALTALEASLRATLRFEVIPADAARAAFGDVTGPLVRTADFLVPTGMDPDLDAAMRACVRSALALMNGGVGDGGAPRLRLPQCGDDFDISQVVDIVSGVHARIREADFATVPAVGADAIGPRPGCRVTPALAAPPSPRRGPLRIPPHGSASRGGRWFRVHDARRDLARHPHVVDIDVRRRAEKRDASDGCHPPADLRAAFEAYERAIVATTSMPSTRSSRPDPRPCGGDPGGLLVGHDAISGFRSLRGGVPRVRSPTSTTVRWRAGFRPDAADDAASVDGECRPVMSVSVFTGGGRGLADAGVAAHRRPVGSSPRRT